MVEKHQFDKNWIVSNATPFSYYQKIHHYFSLLLVFQLGILSPLTHPLGREVFVRSRLFVRSLVQVKALLYVFLSGLR